MLTDLKEIEKFLKICRKQGVSEVTFEGMVVKFGDIPVKMNQIDEPEENQTESISLEDMMLYSVQPGPI